MTLSQALIGELVSPRERARFQGYFAAMFSLASIGGPVIGGLVVSHASWRWLFIVNVPLCAFAVWRLSTLPRGKGHDAAPTQDFPGIVLFAGAMAGAAEPECIDGALEGMAQSQQSLVELLAAHGCRACTDASMKSS